MTQPRPMGLNPGALVALWDRKFVSGLEAAGGPLAIPKVEPSRRKRGLRDGKRKTSQALITLSEPWI